MLRSPSGRAPAAIALLLAVVVGPIACRDSTGPAPRPGVHVVAQPAASDTAGAAPLQALVLEVRDAAGQLSVATPVLLEVESVAPARPSESSINVCLVEQPECPARVQGTAGPQLLVQTNSQGRALAVLRFASLAGQARVHVTVPEFGYATTLSFTTLPAATFGVQPTVQDTALRVGEWLEPRARAVDRFGNARTETVGAAAATSPLLLGADGRVTANALGRGQVTFRMGEREATAFVSVVPAGGYAAIDASNSRIVVASFDGRERRTFPLQRILGAGVAGVDWSPDGRSLLYGGEPYGSTIPLSRLDVETGVSTPVIVATGDLQGVWWGRYSADGSTILFSGLVGGEWHLYRANADGSDARRLGPPRDPTRFVEWRGNPSDDGRTMAYITAVTEGAVVIRLLDLVTGAVTPLDVPGQTPRVSPDGRFVAFVPELGGQLMVMKRDGTDARVLPTDLGYFGEGSFDWSPDGEWLIAASGGALHLVNSGSARMIQIPGTERLLAPAWRP